MIVILLETLAPPIIAVNGRLASNSTLSMLTISLFIRLPKHLFWSKKEAITAVDAWALWAVPKASFTNMSPSLESSCAKCLSPSTSSL